MRAYNVLGDVAEYEAKVLALEKPREPTPPADPFDMSCVPDDILTAMNTDSAVYQPILQVFKDLLAERQSLADEHARVTALAQVPGALTPPSQSVAALEATRGSRCVYVCNYATC